MSRSNAETQFQEPTGPFGDYVRIVVEAFQRPTERLYLEDEGDASRSILAQIFLEPAPTQDPPVLSSTETHARDLFQDLMQLRRAFEELLDHEVYIRRFPYSDTRVSRTRHLTSVVSSYFQAVYVFKERLKRHLNLLDRLYRPSRLRLEVSKRVDSLGDVVENELLGWTKVRGSHVHAREFVDPEIEVVESLDFMLEVTDLGELELVAAANADRAFRAARKRWRETILENNEKLLPLLDRVFAIMLECISDDEGLRYPTDHT